MAGRSRNAARALLALAALCVAGAVGFSAGKKQPTPVLSPNERLADTAVVLVAVRDLARLESVSFHMERVIDLKQRTDRLFGLIQANDEILLVAAGDVSAGVDLAKLRDGDIVVEPRERRVRINLPPPEILSVRLDNQRTYVHTRRTELLAERSAQIESHARQLAEDTIRKGALDSGILERARANAEQTLTLLVRALDFDRVELAWSED